MALKDADGRTASCFLVVEDPKKVSTWHLPVKDPDGTANHRLMGQAWAALHGGLRGNRYSGPGRAEALRKLTALYKSEGLPLPSAKMSADDLERGYEEIAASGKQARAAAELARDQMLLLAEQARQQQAADFADSTRSPLLARLVNRLRARLAKQGVITSDEFEAEYRHALGHAGGTTAARNRANQSADEEFSVGAVVFQSDLT